jgi:hypothetical protein
MLPWQTPGFQIDAINIFVKKVWPKASSVAHWTCTATRNENPVL